jgi:hypothetical protein
MTPPLAGQPLLLLLLCAQAGPRPAQHHWTQNAW